MEDFPLELTLIVVNYHSRQPLSCLLESLREHPIAASHEVVVVSNSPDDGLDRWLEREHPEVRYLPSKANVGYARAVNAGIASARGREILVINPDVRLEESCVDRALEYLRANPEVGILGVRLCNADGSDQHNARRFYTLTTILLRRTPLGRIWPQHRSIRDHLMLDDDLRAPRPVDWVTGAFMLARREALDSVGGMDERFFLYFEDVDWCQRMWEGGFEVHLFPEVQLRHEHQRTSTRINRSLLHHLRSFFSYYDKWGALIYVARRLRRSWTRAIAVLSDVVALNLAFVAAFVVRRSLDPIFPEALFDFVDYLPLLAFTNVVSVVTLMLLGRYSRSGGGGRFRASLKAAFLVVLVVMAGTYLSHLQTFSRAVILLFVPFYLLALEVTRRGRERVLGGSGTSARPFHRALLLATQDPGRVERGEDWVLVGSMGVRPATRDLGPVDRLTEVVERYRIDEILIESTVAADPALVESVTRLAAQGCDVLREDLWAAHSGRGWGPPRERLGRHWRRWEPLKS